MHSLEKKKRSHDAESCWMHLGLTGRSHAADYQII